MLNNMFSLTVSLSSTLNFRLCYEMRTRFVLLPGEPAVLPLVVPVVVVGLLGFHHSTTFGSIDKTDRVLFLDSIQARLAT